MNIDNSNTRVTFSFTPAEYFLVHAKDSRFPSGEIMAWSLNQRIDMSYADKGDQVGMEVMYLTDEEAEACRNAGFSYMEI